MAEQIDDGASGSDGSGDDQEERISIRAPVSVDYDYEDEDEFAEEPESRGSGSRGPLNPPRGRSGRGERAAARRSPLGSGGGRDDDEEEERMSIRAPLSVDDWNGDEDEEGEEERVSIRAPISMDDDGDDGDDDDRSTANTETTGAGSKKPPSIHAPLSVEGDDEEDDDTWLKRLRARTKGSGTRSTTGGGSSAGRRRTRRSSGEFDRRSRLSAEVYGGKKVGRSKRKNSIGGDFPGFGFGPGGVLGVGDLTVPRARITSDAEDFSAPPAVSGDAEDGESEEESGISSVDPRSPLLGSRRGKLEVNARAYAEASVSAETSGADGRAQAGEGQPVAEAEVWQLVADVMTRKEQEKVRGREARGDKGSGDGGGAESDKLAAALSDGAGKSGETPAKEPVEGSVVGAEILKECIVDDASVQTAGEAIASRVATAGSAPTAAAAGGGGAGGGVSSGGAVPVTLWANENGSEANSRSLVTNSTGATEGGSECSTAEEIAHLHADLGWTGDEAATRGEREQETREGREAVRGGGEVADAVEGDEESGDGELAPFEDASAAAAMLLVEGAASPAGAGIVGGGAAAAAAAQGPPPVKLTPRLATAAAAAGARDASPVGGSTPNSARAEAWRGAWSRPLALAVAPVRGAANDASAAKAAGAAGGGVRGSGASGRSVVARGRREGVLWLSRHRRIRSGEGVGGAGGGGGNRDGGEGGGKGRSVTAAGVGVTRSDESGARLRVLLLRVAMRLQQPRTHPLVAQTLYRLELAERMSARGRAGAEAGAGGRGTAGGAAGAGGGAGGDGMVGRRVREMVMGDAQVRAGELEEESLGCGQLGLHVSVLVLGRRAVGKSATVRSLLDLRAPAASHPGHDQLPGLGTAGADMAGNERVLLQLRRFLAEERHQQQQQHQQGSSSSSSSSVADVVLLVDRLDWEAGQGEQLEDLEMLSRVGAALGRDVWRSVVLVLTHAAAATPTAAEARQMVLAKRREQRQRQGRAPGEGGGRREGKRQGEGEGEGEGEVEQQQVWRAQQAALGEVVARRAQYLQQCIRVAAGDQRLCNPVVVAENGVPCWGVGQGSGSAAPAPTAAGGGSTSATTITSSSNSTAWREQLRPLLLPVEERAWGGSAGDEDDAGQLGRAGRGKGKGKEGATQGGVRGGRGGGGAGGGGRGGGGRGGGEASGFWAGGSFHHLSSHEQQLLSAAQMRRYRAELAAWEGRAERLLCKEQRRVRRQQARLRQIIFVPLQYPYALLLDLPFPLSPLSLLPLFPISLLSSSPFLSLPVFPLSLHLFPLLPFSPSPPTPSSFPFPSLSPPAPSCSAPPTLPQVSAVFPLSLPPFNALLLDRCLAASSHLPAAVTAQLVSSKALLLLDADLSASLRHAPRSLANPVTTAGLEICLRRTPAWALMMADGGAGGGGGGGGRGEVWGASGMGSRIVSRGGNSRLQGFGAISGFDDFAQAKGAAAAADRAGAGVRAARTTAAAEPGSDGAGAARGRGAGESGTRGSGGAASSLHATSGARGAGGAAASLELASAAAAATCTVRSDVRVSLFRGNRTAAGVAVAMGSDYGDGVAVGAKLSSRVALGRCVRVSGSAAAVRWGQEEAVGATCRLQHAGKMVLAAPAQTALHSHHPPPSPPYRAMSPMAAAGLSLLHWQGATIFGAVLEAQLPLVAPPASALFQKGDRTVSGRSSGISVRMSAGGNYHLHLLTALAALPPLVRFWLCRPCDERGELEEGSEEVIEEEEELGEDGEAV
ncbi:unnamed protein product [Closterium sp. Naga37s-1]|nr:unnamed protein product [Closterium sp. Naga37s-1]